MPAARKLARSQALRELKHELAAGYRMLGREGLGRGLLAHLTARLPGAGTFWTYQFGQSVEEVRARDLCEADFDVAPIDKRKKINPTLRIHGLIYAARPDVLCIAHHHGDNGVAMGAIGALLRPFDRNAARWHGELDIIEDYDKAYRIASQGRAIVAKLGKKKALLLKHHGVLVSGRSVRDTVISTIELERSLGVQLKAMAAGRIALMPEKEIADAKGFLASDAYIDGTWNYLRRVLARA